MNEKAKAEMHNSLKIISVLGTSFSGSSLFNMMMDSHPKIFGGGELLKIFYPQKKAFCSICLTDCPFWNWDDDKNWSRLTRENLYHLIANKSGTSIIVDSSKNPDHFVSMTEATSPSIIYFPIILTKHPIRLAASFLANKYIPTTVGLDDYSQNQFRNADPKIVIQRVASYFKKVARHYNQAKQVSQPWVDSCQRIAYESVVSNPKQSISSILKKVDLEWSDTILDFSNQEHHPIGGNSAAHYHISRQPNPEQQKRREKKMIPEKLSFYQDRHSGLRLDNKYREMLSDEMLNNILMLDEYSELCSQLGYSNKIEHINRTYA